MDEADLSKLSVDGLELFVSEETTDFEEIINSLRVAGRMATFHESSDQDLAARLAADADLVKAALADTLARNHPDNVGDIELEEYKRAREFLANFGHVFTVSYDLLLLLLYWALMQEMEPHFKADDGFRQDRDEPDADWVRWDSYKPFSQNIYYLHGGLHLFEEGPTLKKLTFSRTGIALIEQIPRRPWKRGLPARHYGGHEPGEVRSNSSQRLPGQRTALPCHLPGLTLCPWSFLRHQDAHVFRAVGSEGKFRALFVSLHGDVDSETNLEIRRRAAAIAAERPPGRALAVHFYEADSAAAWG